MSPSESIPPINNDSLKVGIIGTGFGSVVHYPGFSHHGAFDPVAIAGRHLSKTKHIAEQLEIDYFTDWKKIVRNDEIDVISIATPPHTHKEMTTLAIQEGKHVLVEKPMALKLDDAEEMAKMAEDSGTTAMVDLELRYIPIRAYMVELIKNGYLGKIYQLDIIVRNPSRLNPRTRGYNWWADKKRGGGIMNALGSHYLDFLYQIFDEILEVSGKTATHLPKRLNKMTGRMKKVTSDDAFVALFRVPEETLVSMKMSTTNAFGLGPRIEAYGSEGALVMSENQCLYGGKLGEDNKLQQLTIPKRFLLPKYENGTHYLVAPFTRLLDEMDKGIKNGMSLHPNFNDGVRIQAALDAFWKSNKTGRWVSVD